jgi:hypothetical protein
MKIFTRFLTILFLAIMAAGYVLIPDVGAEEGSCILQATNTDVFIIIYDMTPDGTQGDQIWQGRINAGQSARIKTPNGRFLYDYNSQPDTDQPLSGGNERWCSNDEVILVP